jgi:hypothetical protein
MNIKPQNLLRSLLLIPYIAWGMALLFSKLAYGPDGNAPNAFLDVLAGIATFFTVAIIGWGIPYTILAVGLFLWSIKKPTHVIYKVFLISPILLSILTAVEVAYITFSPLQKAPSHIDFLDFLSYALLTVVSPLIFGYIFVGLCAVIYKVIGRLNLLKNEAEPRQVSENMPNSD